MQTCTRGKKKSEEILSLASSSMAVVHTLIFSSRLSFQVRATSSAMPLSGTPAPNKRRKSSKLIMELTGGRVCVLADP